MWKLLKTNPLGFLTVSLLGVLAWQVVYLLCSIFVDTTDWLIGLVFNAARFLVGLA